MTTRRQHRALIHLTLILSALALAAHAAWPRTADSKSIGNEPAGKTIQAFPKVSVELPASKTLFPSGEGAAIANGQCLICHSAGMVLLQPALTQDQWISEINKMRNRYGAPLPADQVEPLARYLHGLNPSTLPISTPEVTLRSSSDEKP